MNREDTALLLPRGGSASTATTAVGQADRPAAAAEELLVTVAQDADRDDWQRWLETRPDATIFHDWAWRRILAEAFGHRPHYLIARRGDRVAGVLPMVQVRTLLFGHSLVSLPFCPYAGPLADDRGVHDALDARAEAIGREQKVDFIEYRSLHESHRDWPRQDLYFTFRKPILADVDANLAAVPRKQRAMVRKGIRNALRSDTGDLDAFFALFADNVHRHGTPVHSKRFFELILEGFGERAEVLVVRDARREPVSAVLSLYHRDEVLPMHAGDAARARELAANDFKYWELMRRAAERGCRVFDYGRSKRGTGPFDFKRNWGFEPTPLCYEYRLLGRDRIPQNNPLNPRYRLLIATWRRLPRWFVNALGPHLVRGLG